MSYGLQQLTVNGQLLTIIKPGHKCIVNVVSVLLFCPNDILSTLFA